MIVTGRLIDAATGRPVLASQVNDQKVPANRNEGASALSSSGLVDPTFRLTVPPPVRG